MSKFCSYKYVAGKNKNQTCQTFLRGRGELCYKHKKFGKGDVVPETKQVETKPVEEIAKIETVNPVAEEKPAPIIQETVKKAEVKPVAKPSPLAQSTTVKKDKVIQLKADPSSSSSSYDTTTESSSWSTSSSD